MVALLAGRFRSNAFTPFLPGKHGFTDMDTAVVYDISLYNLVTVCFHDLCQAVTEQVITYVAWWRSGLLVLEEYSIITSGDCSVAGTIP